MLRIVVNTPRNADTKNFRFVVARHCERAMALCFDIVVQITVTGQIKAETHDRADGKSENVKMKALAEVVADHAKPEYRRDVLIRKMTFVDRQGAVHGDKYDIGCWGIG